MNLLFKMRNSVYLLFGVVILFLVQACEVDKHAKNYNTDTPDTDAVSFINQGIKVSITEIKASGLAITNSSNQRVIGLAIMMIDDNTKAEERLKQVAANKMIVAKDTIDVAHQQLTNDLSKKSGAAFDKAYVQMMVTDHEQELKLFAGGAQNNDPEIKSLAAKTLPTIQMHLDSANAILKSLK